MATVYLGLGTNIGDKKKNITDATIIIGSVMGNLRILSSLYETEPWGYESPNTFLNAVYVFDKTDDMFVNPTYTDAINGTSDSVTG